MAKEGMIVMSVKESSRIGIIQQVIKGKIAQIKAGGMIGITDRQIRRLVERVKTEGIRGLIHRSRGREKELVAKKREKVLKMYKEKYYDFGPTFASEKLDELNGIKVDHETLRLWLMKWGENSTQKWCRKSRPHKKWRERKECFGEMVQMDGSHHDWLEGRGPELVLMGYVDDATGEKFGKFYLYEGTVPAMGSFNEYVEKYGIPLSIYLDKHSTYKTTRHQTIFEELNDKKALTQFERAMEELGVKVIHAHSAPAKGRVENMFKTFQDRLIKEMRLADIKTLEDANKFLEGFLAKYNKRFRVLAKNPANLHRKKPAEHVLESILCTKEERSLRKDSTIRHKNKVYLITEPINNRVNCVNIEERLDCSIYIKHKDRCLKYKVVEPSVKVGENKLKLGKQIIKWRKYNKNSRPAKDHPWRTRKNSDYHIDINEFSDIASKEILAKMA